MTLAPWLNALLLAAVFALAQQLDGPDDIKAAQDVAADVQAAVQTAQAQPNTPSHPNHPPQPQSNP